MRIRTLSSGLVTDKLKKQGLCVNTACHDGHEEKTSPVFQWGVYLYASQTPDSAPQPTKISMCWTVAAQHVEIRVMKIRCKAELNYRERLVGNLRGYPVGDVLRKYRVIDINFK